MYIMSICIYYMYVLMYFQYFRAPVKLIVIAMSLLFWFFHNLAGNKSPHIATMNAYIMRSDSLYSICIK